MEIVVVDIKCPLCHSEKCRSKTHDGNEWNYICDNFDDPHVINYKGVEMSLRDRANELQTRMFYFTESGRLTIPGFNDYLVVKRQERMTCKS